MREFNVNIPITGLKQNETSVKGHLALNNLRVGDGYFSVPKAYTLPWERSAQLLRGKDVTLLWKEGEEAEPEELPEGAIEITSVAQVELFGTTEYPLDGYYYLSGDIDASDTETWHGGEGYDPPCQTPATRFQGTFDGCGYTISGLHINRPTEQGVGLFGTIGSEATVKNLTMADVDITGFDNVGGLSGGCSGRVENCHSSGTVKGSFTVGGLIGNNASKISVIEKCSSSCNVTLVFDETECYYGGGLIGNSIGTVLNCYASGDVAKTQYSVHNVGGLVGYLGADGTIDNCYSVGSVVSSLTGGGLVGASDGAVTASYYDSETSGYSDTGKGTPKTTAEMKSQTTFVGWNFTTVWQIADSYPYHRQAFDVTHDSLYTINETTLALTGLYNTARADVWQMADYGPYAILTDGTTTLLYNDGVVTPTTTRLGAVCARDARLIYGDVGSYPNAVGWSAIDGADIPDILAGTALSGVQATRNTTGIAEMPWRGKVLAILPMGDTYIIYGEDGIAALREIQGGLGFVDVAYPAHLGLYARGAVAGSDQQHVFRGTDGGLWMISPKLEVVKLDYAWTLNTHDRIVYEPVENLFWISDDTESYCLSTGGLAGPIDQVPSSLALIGDKIVGTGTAYTEPEEEGDPLTVEAFIHTNTFDMGMNGQKRVTVVNLHGEFSHATVGCLYKYSSSDTFREKAAVLCSPEGAAFLNIALVYGQLKITATMEPEARITKVELRYQAHDRRFIRGTRGFVGSENENGNA